MVRLDGRTLTLTPADALGLKKFGKVRPIEAPHSQANFVMREMGYIVARRHADKLRTYAVCRLFVVPALCCLALSGAADRLCATVRPDRDSLGCGWRARRALAVLRRSQHVVTLYYGAEAA